MDASRCRIGTRFSKFGVSIVLLLVAAIGLEAQNDCDGAKFFDFSVLAGPASGPGYADGMGAAANFYMPGGVAVDGEGTIWVADTGNHVIRKITPDGVVTTHAGIPGVPGSNDGKTHEARFNSPRGIYVDSVGLIYVADFGNHTIRRIDDELNVVTIGGVPGVAGEVDGPFGTALFNGPSGIIADTPDIVVTDALGHTIRYISLGGQVQTVGGQPNTPGHRDGLFDSSLFNTPTGITVDLSGNVWIADSGNHVIRGIAVAQGLVFTAAGSAGETGDQDGTGASARFDTPVAVAADLAGHVFVLDSGNFTVRRGSVTGAALDIETVSGAPGVSGYVDAAEGSDARFEMPVNLAASLSGETFVAELSAGTIRMIETSGATSTIAGTRRQAGSTDGPPDVARFDRPGAAAIDASGNVFVADRTTHVIRKIAPDGSVTTIAGSAGQSGTSNGAASSARFNEPGGVAVDASGDVYVADTGNHSIRRVTAAGVVSTLAGMSGSSGSADGTGSSARFSSPQQLVIGGDGALYTTDSGNSTVRRISMTGAVTTVAGMPGVQGDSDGAGENARFQVPMGIAAASGVLYVSDSEAHTVRRITGAGVVTTVAGKAGEFGSAGGASADARFDSPAGLAADSSGNVWIADMHNQVVRRLSPTGFVTTVGGATWLGGTADGLGSEARFSEPVSVVFGGEDELVVVSNLNGVVHKGQAVTPLCLDDRFAISLQASDPRTEAAGLGLAIPQSDLFGYFAIPDLTSNPGNPEVFVKMLDGRVENGNFWVFYGGLTDFQYDLLVTDSSEGVNRTYRKDGGSFCGGADTSAFAGKIAPSAGRLVRFDVGGMDASSLTSAGEAECGVDALCLFSNRFSLTLDAKDPRTEATGTGMPIPQTDLFGYFSIPDLTSNPDNPEVFVKLLDGRVENGSFWVFYGGLTDFELTLTVTDSETMLSKVYTKDGGSYCGGADTSAFQ